MHELPSVAFKKLKKSVRPEYILHVDTEFGTNCWETIRITNTGFLWFSVTYKWNSANRTIIVYELDKKLLQNT